MPGGMVVDEELHLRHYEPPDKINYIQLIVSTLLLTYGLNLSHMSLHVNLHFNA